MYLIRQLKPLAPALTPCSKGQGGNVQIRDASESLLKDFWVVKPWLKWLLHVLWKLKASIFAQSLGRSGWIWPCYFKASNALLKIKENIAASNTNGPPAPSNHLKVLKQSKAINIITKLYPSSWESYIYSSFSLTGIYVWLYFPFFLQSQVSCL